MRNIYIATLVLSLLTTVSIGQITVDNSTFPAPGDSLTTGVDITFSAFDPEVKGADLVWDFTSLTTPTINTVIYSDAAEGENAADFPEADLLVLGNGVVQDIYYKTSNNRIVELGRAGVDPVFGAVDVNVDVTGNSVLRRAPLGFEDTYDDEFGFSIELPASALPDSISSLLLGVSDIRIAVNIEVEDEIDAWGTIMLPDGDHEVLRMNRQSMTTTSAEVKFFGSWVDLSNLPIALPEFVTDLLAPSLTNNYMFYSNDVKEVLVNVLVDSTGTILNTEFKSNDITSSVSESKIYKGDIIAYPNPSYGNVTFSFRNLPISQYRVDVYDVLGRKVWSDTSKNGQTTLDAHLSELRRGTYLYRVFDNKGQKIVTKRLMIVRP